MGWRMGGRKGKRTIADLGYLAGGGGGCLDLSVADLADGCGNLWLTITELTDYTGGRSLWLAWENVSCSARHWGSSQERN